MPGAEEKRKESSLTLSSADVTRIRGALHDVLVGGPYKPIYSLSEGIVCTLELRVGSDPPFFRIDKSRGGEGEDAVDRVAGVNAAIILVRCRSALSYLLRGAIFWTDPLRDGSIAAVSRIPIFLQTSCRT